MWYPRVVEAIEKWMEKPDSAILPVATVGGVVSVQLIPADEDGNLLPLEPLERKLMCDHTRRVWAEQLTHLADAHIFEFDNDTTQLLSMTKNDEFRCPSRLPFEKVFLDCRFKVTDWECVGLLLRNECGASGPPLCDCVAYMLLDDGNILDFATVVGATSQQITRSLEVAMNLPQGKIHARPRQANKELRVLNRMVHNFLDLLDSSDVRYASIGRQKSNRKRARERRPPLPPSTRVLLRAPLKHYVTTLRQGGHLSYSHAFWVRGHFRHYHADRYAHSGLQGKKKWIPPFIKGQGLLVKKAYDLAVREENQ